MKPLIELTDEEAAHVSLLAFTHPEIDDLDPREFWSGEGRIENDKLVLEVGCRCFEGTLSFTSKGKIVLRDDDGKAQKIHDPEAIRRYLTEKGYDLKNLHGNE